MTDEIKEEAVSPTEEKPKTKAKKPKQAKTIMAQVAMNSVKKNGMNVYGVGGSYGYTDSEGKPHLVKSGRIDDFPIDVVERANSGPMLRLVEPGSEVVGEPVTNAVAPGEKP